MPQLCIALGVLMSMATMFVVAGLYILRPYDSTLTTAIVGITMPIAMSLIGYGLQGHIRSVYNLADGNLSVVRRDLNVALDKIEELQTRRVEDAQRTIPLVVDGDRLKVPPGSAGLIIERPSPPDDPV